MAQAKHGASDPGTGIAEMIGTSRTQVDFFMSKFRQLAFIAYNGDIKVDRALLTMPLQAEPRIASQD
jgi:hypothetical protein